MPAEPKIVKFVGTVSTSGADKIVIVIPKEHHDKARPLKGKAVKVTIEEIPV